MKGGSDLIETTTGDILLDADTTSTSAGEFLMNIGSGTTVTTQTGSITLTGNRVLSRFANNCIGVLLNSGVTISSTGSGPNVGPITITGNSSSNGGSFSFGISTVATISSVDANIAISGTSSSSALDTPVSGYNIGITAAGSITSTGVGSITITGVGDIDNAPHNYGIDLNGGLTVSAHNGSITLNGTGGGYGADEAGIGTLNTTGNQILSTGTAPITLIGSGANGSAGIEFTSAGNVVGGASANGNISFVADSLNFSALPFHPDRPAGDLPAA